MPEFSVEFWAATVLAVIALLLGVGATLAMDAKTKGEFRFAVGCFIFSGLMIASTIGLWDITTQVLMLKRILISGLLFSIVGVLLVETIRWTHFRHLNARISEPIASKDVSKAKAAPENPPTNSSPSSQNVKEPKAVVPATDDKAQIQIAQQLAELNKRLGPPKEKGRAISKTVNW